MNKKVALSLDQKGFLDEETRKVISQQFLNRLHSRFNFKDGDTSFGDQLEKIVEDYKRTVSTNSAFKPFIWFY
jgi:hypothetical protein